MAPDPHVRAAADPAGWSGALHGGSGAPAPAGPYVPSAALGTSTPAPVDLLVVQPIAASRQRNLLAAGLALLAVVVGLWATLGYLHTTSSLLAQIGSTNRGMLDQMRATGVGMRKLNEQTQAVAPITKGAQHLDTSLTTMQGSMHRMLTDIDGVGASMGSLQTTLGDLTTQVDGMNRVNGALSNRLHVINGGLAAQASAVATLQGAVAGTDAAVATLPGTLARTNQRMQYVQDATCVLGQGLGNPLRVSLDLFGVDTGSAVVSATMIPKGAWSC